MLAALLACAAPAAAADPFGDIPGAVEEVPVDGPVYSAGVEVRARAVRSTARPLDVLAAISKSFRKAGLFIPPPKEQFELATAPQLTGYDAAARRSYTAIFKPDGKGTIVILGSADLSSRGKPAGELPRFPGAVDAIESNDEGGRVLSYRVTATADDVRKFYGEVLGASGYTWSAESKRWEHLGRAVSVTMQRRPEGSLAVVVMEKPL